MLWHFILIINFADAITYRPEETSWPCETIPKRAGCTMSFTKQMFKISSQKMSKNKFPKVTKKTTRKSLFFGAILICIALQSIKTNQNHRHAHTHFNRIKKLHCNQPFSRRIKHTIANT